MIRRRAYIGLGRVACVAVLAMATATASALAPGGTVGGQRIYDEQLRIDLDRQRPGAADHSFDGGGWLNISFFLYEDDAAGKDRSMMRSSVRGWASINIQDVHKGYFRGLLQYDDWMAGGNPINNRGDDFDHRVERAWYQFDLGQLMMRQSGQRPCAGFRVRVGRQFATLGTALALSMPLDAVRFDVTTRWADVKVLLGRTISWTHNIDPSDRVFGQQDRYMVGVELVGKIDQHRPFVYYLLNKDVTDAKPADFTQAYAYNSQYLGIGSAGTILLPRLEYLIELVGEWGDTYGNGANHGMSKDDIRAMALDVQLSHRFDAPTRPRVFGEYLFASGDGDRRTSSTATVGGNRIGTTDHAFNAFGFRDTGIAFAPTASNLHMYMVGASFFPLEDHKCFRNMEVGTKIFIYHKDDSAGALSDTTATQNARWIGWEMDLFINWRITSDLAWTARYGMFRPGSAFNGQGDEASRHFFYTGMVLSF
jgi:hypothetical protein